MFVLILTDKKSLIHVLSSLLKIKCNFSVKQCNWKSCYSATDVMLFLCWLPSFPPFKFILKWHFFLPYLCNLPFGLLILNPVFRQKLGRIFNACILARKCRPDCGHVYGEVSLLKNDTEYVQDMVWFSSWAMFCLFFSD